MTDSKRKEHVDGVEVNNGRKCLYIINLVGLSGVVSNQVSFVTSNGVIRVILDGKHLLVCHNIDIGQA